MARRKNSNIGKTIAVAIAILLLLALIIGLAVYLKDKINKDDIADIFSPDKLVVSVNGEEVGSRSGGYSAGDETPLDVKINQSGYTVKIVSHCSISFDVDIAEGNMLSYVAEGDDLIKGFDIAYNDDGFTVKAKGDLATILEASYPNLTIDMDKAFIEADRDMFLLVISTDKKTYEIGFGLFPISGVTLDKTEIVF